MLTFALIEVPTGNETQLLRSECPFLTLRDVFRYAMGLLETNSTFMEAYTSLPESFYTTTKCKH